MTGGAARSERERDQRNDWIIQLDADCRIPSGYLSSQMEFLDSHPSDLVAGLVTTGRPAAMPSSMAMPNDSLRAVEKCSQHPGKMWVVRGGRLLPLLPFGPPEQPWHSSQYPTLPEIYVQNASLEIAKAPVIFEDKTIAGNVIIPFFTIDYEGFDVNSNYDWNLAEHLAKTRKNRLRRFTSGGFAGSF